MLLNNPFEQFLVTNYFTIEKKWDGFFSFLNHTIYINDTILITLFFIVFNYVIYVFLSFERRKNSKSAIKILLIEVYKFVYDIVKLYLAPKGNLYFPFFFIYFCL